MKPKLIVILGPTAVGKTELSVELASRLNGEIISGDSMQFYKYMDIGTAKIRPEEIKAKNGSLIPHHLIDFLTPDQSYSVADFQKDAKKLVLDINAKGKTPILAGGTGLYVSALVEGYTFIEHENSDHEFRRQKQAEYALKGGEALLAELAKIDPKSAEKIEPADSKKIIRALEVYHLTGKTLSEQSAKNPPDWDITLIGLQREREQLYDRINRRVLQMMDAGFLQEVQNLLAMGYGRDLKPMQGLGYKQLCMYLCGEITYEEAIALIQRDTRRFAKRQLTWWRHKENINWFDLTEVSDIEQILPEIIEVCQ